MDDGSKVGRVTVTVAVPVTVAFIMHPLQLD